MKDNFQVALLEDWNIPTQFMNAIGRISKEIYFATHPEEREEPLVLIVNRKKMAATPKATAKKAA